jgi:hypothetical protein
MQNISTFDFWYAVNNTEILKLPARSLETFGATVINYQHISELMDSVNQVKVREGRMYAQKPQIITPEAYSKTMLEGFGSEAEKYVDWMKSHSSEVRVLQYGYTLKQESFSEHIVSDNIKNVAARVTKESEEKNDPLNAILIGVDKPWDVCLIKLFSEVIQSSAPVNIRDMERKRLFDQDNGIPRGIRHQIDAEFLIASRDSSKINGLAQKLQEYGIFEEYQDRFFALVKANRK